MSTAMPEIFQSIAGKRVVVTGAGSGIGAAVANKLMALGASVIAVDIRPCEGGFEQHISMDLSDRHSVLSAVRSVEGAIDAVCNIAGVPPTAPQHQVLAVNWVGTRLFTESLLEKISPGGSVVLTASQGGRQWRENLAQVRACLRLRDFEDIPAFCEKEKVEPLLTYKLTKETLIAWAMNCARVWFDRGVRCNAISPGIIKTPMLDDALKGSGDRGARFAANAPRIGAPEETAGAYAFLCSDASKIVNGQNIAVDDGLSAILNLEEYSLSL